MTKEYNFDEIDQKLVSSLILDLTSMQNEINKTKSQINKPFETVELIKDKENLEQINYHSNNKEKENQEKINFQLKNKCKDENNSN